MKIQHEDFEREYQTKKFRLAKNITLAQFVKLLLLHVFAILVCM